MSEKPDLPRLFFSVCALSMLCGFAACAVSHGTDEVRSTVKARTGHDLAAEPAEERRHDSAQLLAQPLDADRAVGVAMLRNPRFAAILAELGIARAQVLAASRIDNPELDATMRVNRHESQPELDFMATENLTSLILLPLERSAANQQFAAEQLHAARAAIDLAFEVRRAFYEYQTSVQAGEIAVHGLQAAEAAAAFAAGLREAGNIPELDRDSERVLAEELRIVVAQDEALSAARRERLDALMGIEAQAEPWKLAAGLAAPADGVEPSAAVLESRVVASNLELREFARRAQAAARAHDAAQVRGIVPQLRAGASVEREDHVWGAGPTVGLRLPLFDQGQAAVARASAQQARAVALRRALERELRAAARAASRQLAAAREAVLRYRDVLLPLRASIVEQSQRHYNAMQIGVFQLIEAKRQELMAQRQYVLALRDYWMRRATVDQLLAGGVPAERLGDAAAARPLAGDMPVGGD